LHHYEAADPGWKLLDEITAEGNEQLLPVRMNNPSVKEG
jgi:hypothetical protein